MFLCFDLFDYGHRLKNGLEINGLEKGRNEGYRKLVFNILTVINQPVKCVCRDDLV